jgi:hypothetical protein
MSPVPTTAPPERGDGGNMVSFRLDSAVFSLLKAAAKRRNTSISAFCRELVTAELHNRKEEGTADLYRVAFKTLEEVEVVKGALIQAVRVILHESYNAPIPLTIEEQALPPAEQQRRIKHPKRETNGSLFTKRVLDADDNKRLKALTVLNED